MSRARTAVVHHVDGMRFTTETGTGRTPLFGDEPDEGELSPVEMIVAALAACSAMDVVTIALKKRQDFVRYDVHATAEQRDEYPQVLTRVDLLHEVEGPAVDVNAIRRCIELSATKYCPVNAMVSAGATEVTHRYHVIRTGPSPLDETGDVIVTGPYRRPDIQD